MSIIDKVAGRFLGSKSERDIKEVQPYVDKIYEETANVEKMSNDQLREASAGLKEHIRGSEKEEQKEIDELKLQMEDPQIVLPFHRQPQCASHVVVRDEGVDEVRHRNRLPGFPHRAESGDEQPAQRPNWAWVLHKALD